ncbi:MULTISPECIES: class I SAM-dependent DNA methyltransferase [Streptomyces]|uniref:Class I SAM-dependent DNA methyltransferase n=1 Tax=Streptomyces ardesiacus TaxID=285564 RepID=A0ABW8HJ87_9ACTN|nr:MULTISPECIES: class I SAM-dependent methyltransferase [Streptomyces]NEB58496.1 methyltransferase domain-containing protein [Streptomyces diastaticus]KOU02669.1 methyltransferase [Streptomyces sp. NRRL F-4711]KOX33569.1 methyltransferase [Streptomyces sp. NRRL F-4707]KOX45194.1 methyltransferase [Streptomyces sp. NRRL F-7442]MCL7366346.1 methyltransferase domain-containing protein [Streptomyces ardesiacus]
MTADPAFVATTRTFYDAVAEDYHARFRTVLDDSPLDRALLGAFAELVGPEGEVADLGCGPGLVTAHLASLGLRVFGLDLSASMLAIARRENPGLRFEQGSMLELDLPDGALAGAVSWYSSIHTPWERLPDLFGEIGRVLAPGGHLLLGFQAGDEPRRHDRPWGHPVALDFQRRQPDRMAELLERAGFTVLSRTVRVQEADPSAPLPQAACLIARR